MAADHLSLYQLTIEDGTAFGKRHSTGGLPGLPDEDLAADMYFVTQELCAKAGLPAYEVSNHAAPGAHSRHNLIYWQGGDYAGIGPGAHGRLTLNGTRFASDTPLTPGAWLKQVETVGNGENPRTALPGSEQAAEYLMMGLRISEGISLARHQNMADDPLDNNIINGLADDGFVEVRGDALRVTAKGRPLLCLSSI